MARIYHSGFELQSVTAGIEFDTITGTGTLSIDTSIKHSGLASFKASVTGSPGQTAFVEHTYGTGTQTTQYHRFYLYVDTALSGTDTIYRVRSSTTSFLSLQMNTDRTIGIYDEANGSTATLRGTSSALALATWYYIEVFVDYTNGLMSLRINGAAEVTSVAFDNTLGTSPNRFQCGVITTSSGILYFDDITIDTSTWVGASSIVHLQPNAIGDTNNTAGTYTAVDEITPNDATDFVTLVTNGDIFEVNLATSASAGIGSSDKIIAVAVGYREKALTTASEGITLRIKSASGGALTESGTITHGNTTWRTNGDGTPRVYRVISATDPTTGLAWTPTGTNSIDNAQIGAKAIDAAPDINISTLWLLVEYNSAPTVALNTPTDTATGVSTTPALEFTGTDADSDDVRYNIQIATSATIDTSLTQIAGTGADDASAGAAAWNNPGNITANDGTEATTSSASGQTSHYLKATNFGFAIPTGAVILGISVDVERRSTSGASAHKDSTIRLVKGGTIGSTDRADTTIFYPTAATVKTYGNSSDLWGDTWTATDINASNFGFAMQVVTSASITAAAVDYISITVYYSDVVLNKISGTDSGFVNTVTGGDTDPFNSGEKASFTVQAGDILTGSTTYYWRVRGKDPSGTNTFGAWATTRSFTTASGATGPATHPFFHFFPLGR